MTSNAPNRRDPAPLVCAILAGVFVPANLVLAQSASRNALDAPPTKRATDEEIHHALRELNEFLTDLAKQEEKMEAGETEKITFSDSFLDSALVLATSNDARAVSPLLELSKSWISDVGFFGSQALGRLECAEKYGVVVPLLQNEKWWTRRNAALVLGRSTVCDKTTALALIKSLGDQSWQVRMHASWALGRHQVSDAISELEKLSQAQSGKRDGEEAARAIAAVKGTLYKVSIRHQPLWFLVVDQDIPMDALGAGPIITFSGAGNRKNMFGYEYIESTDDRPLKLSFAKGQLFYYGGNGAVKVSPEDTEVRVACPYHPSVAPKKDDQ